MSQEPKIQTFKLQVYRFWSYVSILMAYLQERENQAVYRDAHVIEVQRRLHNVGACMCVFVVRYDDDDNTEVNI